jgi:hypothetical protein
MSELVYFSAADRQMENFLDAEAFDRSLVLNVLFQPGILVPDILFAISGGLEIHLRNPNLTLFEACIEDGLLVPSFRDPSVSSFTDAIRLIRKQGIQGVRDSAEDTMLRLQLAAARNKSFRAYVPKKHLGLTFDKRLEVLQKPIPPLLGPTFDIGMSQGELQRHWILTERWRTRCIDQARETTRQKTGGEPGVRRGEIMNAVAQDLTGGSLQTIDDIGVLFAAHLDKPELRVFFQWICEIYAYNHATEMDIYPNLPAFNFLTPVSLATDSIQASPPVMNYGAFPSISETVEFPPVRVLKRVAPRNLLSVRREKGAEYLANVAAWQGDPTNSRRDEAVRKSLRRYADEIVKWSKTEIKSPVNLVLSHVPPSWRWWARLGGGIAVKELWKIDPVAAAALGIFVAVADGGYAVYQGLYQKTEKQNVTLTAPGPPVESEVNILTPDASGVGEQKADTAVSD